MRPCCVCRPSASNQQLPFCRIQPTGCTVTALVCAALSRTRRQMKWKARLDFGNSLLIRCFFFFWINVVLPESHYVPCDNREQDRGSAAESTFLLCEAFWPRALSSHAKKHMYPVLELSLIPEFENCDMNLQI